MSTRRIRPQPGQRDLFSTAPQTHLEGVVAKASMDEPAEPMYYSYTDWERGITTDMHWEQGYRAAQRQQAPHQGAVARRTKKAQQRERVEPAPKAQRLYQLVVSTGIDPTDKLALSETKRDLLFQAGYRSLMGKEGCRVEISDATDSKVGQAVLNTYNQVSQYLDTIRS